MESTILEVLPFNVDLEQLKKNLRVKEGTEMVGKIEGMAREAQKIARPRVCYRVSYVESKGDDHLMIEGIQFTSRILRVKLDRVFRVFPYVATCGLELEEWSRAVEGILEQFWAEAILVFVGHRLQAQNVGCEGGRRERLTDRESDVAERDQRALGTSAS